METKIENVQVPRGVDKFKIINVQGYPLLPKRQVNIIGNIDSVLKFLEKRYKPFTDEKPKLFNEETDNIITPFDSYITISREKKIIELVINETDPHAIGKVQGKLEFDERYKQWKINTGIDWEQKEFAQFCKLNRSLFLDSSVAMKIYKELMDVRIKLTKEIESSNDNRGSDRQMVSQTIIENNIPLAFTLFVPIFKGTPKMIFDVEIYVSPIDFSVTLTSPQANDIVSTTVDSIIDEQKAAIQTLCPDLVIIEQ